MFEFPWRLFYCEKRNFPKQCHVPTIFSPLVQSWKKVLERIIHTCNLSPHLPRSMLREPYVFSTFQEYYNIDWWGRGNHFCLFNINTRNVISMVMKHCAWHYCAMPECSKDFFQDCRCCCRSLNDHSRPMSFITSMMPPKEWPLCLLYTELSHCM